jgi:hypothetical protein
MVSVDDFKLSIREVVTLVIFCVGLSGSWYKFTGKMDTLFLEIEAIPAKIRQGDVKIEMQTLRMELSYMAARARTPDEEITYQSKLRTLARLEEEWATLQNH